MRVHLNSDLCKIANRLKMSLVHFVHAELDDKWRGENESIKCSQLYYILKGSAKLICNDDTSVTFEAGNMYLLPSGLAVKYWCDDFMENVCFHFKLCNIDRVDVLQNCKKPYKLKIEDDISETLLSLIDSKSTSDAFRIQQILYSLLFAFVDTYEIPLGYLEPSACVSKAISYINKHLALNLSVDEIARNAYVSKGTLERRFKEELNYSVHEFLLDAVMLEASQLLLNSDLPISAISEQFGFCDQFYFSKRFKAVFGKSPKDFRKTASM